MSPKEKPKIGRNTNTNAGADVNTGVTLNPTTSVKIADANPNRIAFRVSIKGEAGVSKSLMIKYQPAATDNSVEKGSWMGMVLMGNDTVFKVEHKMDKDNIMTDEICAQSDFGNPIVYVTEY